MPEQNKLYDFPRSVAERPPSGAFLRLEHLTYNIDMESIQFEWDENKNRINQHKHGISFLEAKTVFYDEEALVIDDPEHSEQEDRFIILGLSSRANLLVVCHCYRASDTVIRIISARKATKTESKYYGK